METLSIEQCIQLLEIQKQKLDTVDNLHLPELFSI